MKSLRWFIIAGLVFLLVFGVVAIYFSGEDKNNILILEYHRVNDVDDDEYTISTKEFRKQIEYLSEQGYSTISLMNFIRAKKYGDKLPDKSVILTFDDGYEDNYTEVMPILAENNMTGTVFIITNSIGLEGYLTWDQLREMQLVNMEIGSHTANHIPLASLEPEKINDEIHLSKLLMEWKGLKTIYFFSYPNGSYNDTAQTDLRADGYLGAVTGDPGINTFATDAYRLQRTYIPRSKLGMLDFKLRILKSKLYTEFNIKQNKI
ncbi:polysaccharide deacetylase family protein [Pectinatus haikarae]|uniref:Peptidoglycan/xylan/chitin deacetylase (PgdA/CDA1 family) n=1 Tax=Pectinatus haikarae TaxID=349096 RepID=A0ABT9Y4E9_9FIRM|nr:polysaccharide deacetylase family protein [Pectinatus haikarae]MDQ0202697.1 peptidoglycan/xylan/chitin deacetylase (PgdA/CDA1 family) [Pectinatus haikarae]